MRGPHLLRVEEPAPAFAPLIAAAAAAGLRAGWLELRPPEVVPPGLAGATQAGARRAVAIGGGQSVAVKTLAGEPVLRDLLREHFRGCALVLVRDERDERVERVEITAPLLAPRGDGWAVTLAGGTARPLTTAALVAALRSPHAFEGRP